MMPDEEIIDPSLEEKRLDEMPQFEDEENPSPTESNGPTEETPEGTTAQTPDAAAEAPPIPPKPPSSSQPERPLPRDMETMVLGIAQDDTNSLAGTELEISEAKNFLQTHKLRRALSSVDKAESSLAVLEEDVLYLRRNIAMLHRLLNEKKISENDIETILLRLRSATGAAEIGDVGGAAGEVEFLVDDLIGGNTSTLNPFLFRHFWMGLETRWPAGGDEGVLVVRIINDGPVAMPPMRLSPPVPDGWSSTPSSVDLPTIAPGGNLPVRFNVSANRRYGADEIPLSRKLAITTGYEIRTGEVFVTIRAQNRSMEPLADILLSPWFPPGYTADSVPFVERLAPDEVAIIRIPLRITMSSGGSS